MSFGKPYLRRVPGPVPGTHAIPGLTDYAPAPTQHQAADGQQLVLGPHAPKDVFPQLDPQGYQNKEVLSTVVNNMLVGKLNCVNQMAIALADITPGNPHFTVFDARVSPYSMVLIQPESVSASFLDLSELGKGYFNLEISQFLLSSIQARGAMETPEPWSQVINTTPAIIGYTVEGTPPPELVTFDPVAHTLTTQMAGLYEISVALDVVNTTASTGIWTGDWAYDRTNADPTADGEAHHTTNGAILSFNFTDDNGGDREAELRGMVIGDPFTADGITWTISGITYEAWGVSFDVLPTTIATNPAVHTFSFQAPIRMFVDITKNGTPDIQLHFVDDGSGRFLADPSGYIDIDTGTVLTAEIYTNAVDPLTVTGRCVFRIIRIGNSPTYEDLIPDGTLDDILFKYAVIG